MGLKEGGGRLTQQQREPAGQQAGHRCDLGQGAVQHLADRLIDSAWLPALLAALACTLCSIGTAGAAPAADPGLVVAIFPPVVQGGDAKERQYLALLIQAHAVELLVATGRYRDLHVKQIRRLAQREGMDNLSSFGVPEQAVPAAARLGADRTAFGELFYKNGVYRLKAGAARVEPGGRAAPAIQDELALPADDKRDAVRAGGQLLARLVARLDHLTPPAAVPGVTSARSENALVAYGRCYAVLVDQSFSSDSPGLLDPDVLLKAEQNCNDAVASDPGFVPAQAARGLASVLLAARGGDQAAARKVFDSLREHPPREGDYQPFFWMALYWLAAHFEPSADTGTAVLREALRRHPGSLILHAFLGRHLNQMEQYEAAEKEWREYLRLSPRSPFVMDRLSYTLARLNRHEEAEKLARQGWDLDHANREAQLALASRYIDNKEWRSAIDLLSGLVQAQGGPHLEVRGEILLRLGYAYMNLPAPDLASAERYLKQAEAVAVQPAEWRTRAHAEMDLAKIYEQQGKAAAAKEAMDKFERYASPLYVQRQVGRDEVLRKLKAERRTDEKIPGFPQAARPPLVGPAAQPAERTPSRPCSKFLGMCFEVGGPGGPPDRKTLPPSGTEGGRSPFN